EDYAEKNCQRPKTFIFSESSSFKIFIQATTSPPLAEDIAEEKAFNHLQKNHAATFTYTTTIAMEQD
ncbi:MAG: hypothetical protein ACOVNX_06155, partial [Sediminibacterium sp.]